MSNPSDPNAQQPVAPAAPAAPATPAAPAAPAAPAYAAPAAPVYTAPRTNTLAIVALIVSFFFSIVGVILGHIALSQIKKTHEGGRGLAIAALIIGYVSIAITVIVSIFLVVVLTVS